MKTKFFYLTALVSVALAGCTTNEYLGDDPGTLQNGNKAITFGGGTNKMTRSDLTGSAAANKLSNGMLVYGVKQNRSTTTNYDKVFTNYQVKYDAEKIGNDEYNNGWYYVGAAGSQTIKYWDWASPDYHFAAIAPIANVKTGAYTLDGTTGDIKSAIVTGLGGHLDNSTSVAYNNAAVYIADAKVVEKAAYNNEVEFTFRSLQTKVRVGIYETIPGYSVTSILFYDNQGTPATSNYITLNSATAEYFRGGASVEGTITYDWTTPQYTFAYGDGLTSRAYWKGGQFTSGVPSVNSADATIDNLYGAETHKDPASGYFIVMPTASATAAAPLTLKCDYILTSNDGSGETIHVDGATATIPATYTKWEANKAYTYLFKISDNTNGKTDPSQPNSGLYPITFDAVVVNVTDADQNVGTETTISTPSITVYQAGDVVANGITYVAGDVTVHAYEGTTDVTGSATWSYVELTGEFNYGADYEKLGASGAATSWTSGKLSSVSASKTYVIKAVTANGTAYFVLKVGAAEAGPANS